MDGSDFSPSGKWEFNEKTTQVFEDMLRRSIPQYEMMRELVKDLAVPFIRPDGYSIDLGCSRGDSIASIMPWTKTPSRWIGVEISQPMRAVAEARFLHHPYISIIDHDLRTGIDDVMKNYVPKGCCADLILSILTVQFVPIEYRLTLIKSIQNAIGANGAFILVEKVLGGNDTSDSILKNQYYAMKGANGYSGEEIERKKLALEGILVPITASWNEEMLRMAGFSTVECFWRSLNFAGWIALNK